ncbi:hypothetical protein [Sphaerisporangium rufum]|nr:hypothetical protein [Sphaerisporangium rufum]
MADTVIDATDRPPAEIYEISSIDNCLPNFSPWPPINSRYFP